MEGVWTGMPWVIAGAVAAPVPMKSVAGSRQCSWFSAEDPHYFCKRPSSHPAAAALVIPVCQHNPPQQFSKLPSHANGQTVLAKQSLLPAAGHH